MIDTSLQDDLLEMIHQVGVETGIRTVAEVINMTKDATDDERDVLRRTFARAVQVYCLMRLQQEESINV